MLAFLYHFPNRRYISYGNVWDGTLPLRFFTTQDSLQLPISACKNLGSKIFPASGLLHSVVIDQ